MGNFFAKKQRSFDSVVLEELNRPLIPDVQHDIFVRLNALEKSQDEINIRLEDIKDSLKALNENIAHRNITSSNDLYKANESIHSICLDMGKLVKNDQILKKQLDGIKVRMDDIEKKNTIQGLYTSESAM